jgi:hypothetical protein
MLPPPSTAPVADIFFLLSAFARYFFALLFVIHYEAHDAQRRARRAVYVVVTIKHTIFRPSRHLPSETLTRC